MYIAYIQQKTHDLFIIANINMKYVYNNICFR